MDDDDPPHRVHKGQTERLTPLGDERAVTEIDPASGALGNSALDPVRSEDVEGLYMPELEFPDLTGLILGGRYKLESHLADGGMGSVYVGTHLELAMPVAIKVMLPTAAALPGYVRRFRREARVMSTLQHRNIVRVHDFGVEDDRPYIVMELLEGQSIARWLHYTDALPSLVEIDELMRQVFDALHVAHGAGIVHRDLKPDNIFLASEGDGIYLVKLLDFGLAHIDDPTDAGPTLTQSGMVSGTPEYMSPEQCRSLQVGPSSDIYALGCILTELLQDAPPFTGKTFMDIMTKQMFMAPPALHRPLDAEPVPPLLERLRQDMLAKEPDQRPPSVSAVRARWMEALQPAANDAIFPARKRASSGGSRAERTPDWTAPEPSPPAPRIGDLLRVAWVRLGPDASAFSEENLVGLAAGGVLLTEVSETSGAIPEELSMVVLDAGRHIDAACAWMDSFDDQSRPRPLVCADTSSDQVGRLIAAGAGDLVNYPVDAPTVLRKLRTLARRFQRRSAKP